MTGLALRWLYSLVWYLVLPLVLLNLWRRGKREPGYRQHWRERLAIYPKVPVQSFVPSSVPSFVIWLHAVSVGETRAAQPLVLALLEHYPSAHILLTHMTPTGRATGLELFAKQHERLQQCYLPYDTGAMQARFIRHFAPRVCILMETEVWPNLVAQCQRSGVPVCLVNARLSERSLRKGQRYAGLIRPASSALRIVAAQTQADAQRLQAIGAQHPVVTGSIKFDVEIPPAALIQAESLRQAIFAQHTARPILLCASTREGEEVLILDAFQRIMQKQPADELPLLLIVPRHPQRFAEVEQLIQERGLVMQRRSKLAAGGVENLQVILGDSMGEMFSYCALADIACIGGSFLPLGGQNPIEACALGKPVLFGQHTFNFAWVCEEAVAAQAALRVADASAMWQQALQLLADRQKLDAMGKHAHAFAQQHRGATQRTLDLLQPYL